MWRETHTQNVKRPTHTEWEETHTHRMWHTGLFTFCVCGSLSCVAHSVCVGLFWRILTCGSILTCSFKSVARRTRSGFMCGSLCPVRGSFVTHAGVFWCNMFVPLLFLDTLFLITVQRTHSAFSVMYLSLFVMCVGVFWHNMFGFPFLMKSQPEEHVYYCLPNLTCAYGVIHPRTHKTVQR